MSVNNSDPRKSGPEGALQPDLAAPLNLATGKLTSDAVAGCLTSSCVVINMCACVVGADMAVLPSAYREIGEDLDATPAQLGMISLAVGITSSCSGLIAGALAGRNVHRTTLVAAGCMFWAITALLMGTVQSYLQLLIARAANGVGVGLVSPLLLSLIADATPTHRRGKAFGVFALTSSLGGTFGGVISTVVAGYGRISVGFNGLYVAGWRCCMIGLCALGILMGGAMLCFGAEPQSKAATSIRPSFQSHCEVAKIPTFQVIVAQGCFGNLPWAAWNFATLWLELNCFSNGLAAGIVAAYTIGQALGQPFGGLLGDWLAARFPDYGRPTVSIVSVGLGIPCVFAFFELLPIGGGAALWPALPYVGLAVAFGFVMSWTLAGTNAPIFAEIVPANKRTLVYGMDAAVEGSAGVIAQLPHICLQGSAHNPMLTSFFAAGMLQAFGAPIAGWMALHVFHYDVSTASANGSPTEASASDGGSHSRGDASCDPSDAHALGQAIVWTMMLPWVFCMLIYCLLLWTYKHDRVTNLATEERGVRPGASLVVNIGSSDMIRRELSQPLTS